MANVNTNPVELTKTATESIFFIWDFSAHIAVSGGTLTGSPTITCYAPNGGSLVTSSSASVSGNQVQALLTGGTSGTGYLMGCSIATSLGETLEAIGGLFVS